MPWGLIVQAIVEILAETFKIWTTTNAEQKQASIDRRKEIHETAKGNDANKLLLLLSGEPVLPNEKDSNNS